MILPRVYAKQLNGTKAMSNNSNTENSKLRILLVSPLPCKASFGGIGTWTIRFVDALKQKQNVEIKVVNSVPVDKNGKDIARSKNIFKKYNCNVRVLKNIKRELKSFKPNVVHLNSSCTPFACVRDNLFLKTIFKKHIPSILHCRCNIEDQINNNKVGLFFFKKNVRISSRILALNKDSKLFVNNLCDLETKCFIVPNFLQKNSVVDYKEINKHIKNVSFVGHLVKQKGIEDIIFLAKEFPDLHFTLVCGYTEQYPNRSRFPQNVEITGNLPVAAVFQKLDKSDVFLLPTHSEGFSNALLESMARGLPIITTNVGANVDMLENKGGIIVDLKSHTQLKNALVKIDDEHIRKEMSVWNIRKVKSSYTEDAVINNILNIYYDLIGAKGN